MLIRRLSCHILGFICLIGTALAQKGGGGGGADPYTYTILNEPASNSNTKATGMDGDTVVGRYVDGSGAYEGFTYSISGNTYVTLDDPNAVDSSQEGTELNGISGNTIIGDYEGSGNKLHGFLYNTTTEGFTTLDDPNTSFLTQPTGIQGGLVVGAYGNAEENYQGFLYNTASQSWTDLEISGATLGSYGDTYPTGISGNTVVGWWDNSNTNGFFGFLYNVSSGVFTSLEGPDGTNDQLLGVSGEEVLGESNGSYFTYDLTTDQYTNILLNPPNNLGSYSLYGINGTDLLGDYGSTDPNTNNPVTYGLIAAVPEPETTCFVLFAVTMVALHSVSLRLKKQTACGRGFRSLLKGTTLEP